jgi:hypothetical protein
LAGVNFCLLDVNARGYAAAIPGRRLEKRSPPLGALLLCKRLLNVGRLRESPAPKVDEGTVGALLILPAPAYCPALYFVGSGGYVLRN